MRGYGNGRRRTQRVETPPSPEAGLTEQRRQRQRSNRATLACERCRLKKLRCIGGHPCNACNRADSVCDFGDGVTDSSSSFPLTNQRIAQLEKTVMDLVSGLSHLTQNPRSPSIPPPITIANTTTNPIPYSSPLVSSQSQSYPLTIPNSLNESSSSFPVDMRRLTVSPTAPQPALSHKSDQPSRRLSSGGSKASPPARYAETLDSRWEALQRNSAPFPPLMKYPAVWSGEPAAPTSQGVSDVESVPGLTQYVAKVGLRSDPVSEGILDKSFAVTLFGFFFRYCHPLFPVLKPSQHLEGDFEQVSSCSPFLVTVIISVAARYYVRHRARVSVDSRFVAAMALDTPGVLADLAYSHLGFLVMRKQHQLADVQAALLLSVWNLRGKGLSPDQWMVTGICARLAHRIGMQEALGHPVIARALNSGQLDLTEIHEINRILEGWHTWLAVSQYDTFLSLGLGRPLMMSLGQPNCRQYLAIVRKLGPLAHLDSSAATYFTGLADLTVIAKDFIGGVKNAGLSPTPRHLTETSFATAWSDISALMAEFNPRLDEWNRQWTWSGSFDAIGLGAYTRLCKIHGEHVRLCVNALALNLIAAEDARGEESDPALLSRLTTACEAAMKLVQIHAGDDCLEPIARYGGDYVVLILGQACVFFIRLMVARLRQPIPIDQAVLIHYLKRAIDTLEANDLSETEICGWIAQLSKDLVRTTGLSLDVGDSRADTDSTILDPGLPDLTWDFDINSLLGQNGALAGDNGLDLGHYYFDFSQLLPQALVSGSEDGSVLYTIPS